MSDRTKVRRTSRHGSMTVRDEDGSPVDIQHGDTFMATDRQLEAWGDQLEVVRQAPTGPQLEDEEGPLAGVPFGSATAKEEAEEAGLEAADFDGMEPEGADGYLTAQVRDLVDQKAQEQAAGEGSQESGKSEGEG